MKQKRKWMVFVFLFTAFALLGCSKEVDHKQQFTNLTRQGFRLQCEYENDTKSYCTIMNSGGSYIQYDFQAVDTLSYEIQSIQYVDSTIGSDKAYRISYPEHEKEASQEDTAKLQDSFDQFIEKLDMDIEDLDAFMLWHRENYPIEDVEYK